MWLTTRKAFDIGVTILVAMLSCILLVQKNRNDALEEQYQLSQQNVKAYMSENDALKDNNRAYVYTIEQLQYSNDSILEEMDDVRKQLKIKDKNIKQLQYINSIASKSDTIVYTDTLFLPTVEHKDTIIQDEWYKLNVTLEYPSTITVTPQFVSDKYVFVSTKREYIDPPSKCWLKRLFQKKHTVAIVDVVERNPYIITNKSRFVEVVQ